MLEIAVDRSGMLVLRCLTELLHVVLHQVLMLWRECWRPLRPDVELTYDYLAAQRFDPNATVKLALDHLMQSR
jgi:hypothetical protein